MKSYMHRNPREQSLATQRALSRSAFTLVELLVVIAIIALLATILTPLARRGIRQSRRSQAYVEVNALATALQSYFSVYNSWEDDEIRSGGEFTEPVMKVLAGDNRRGQVFMEFPQEAWDNPPFRAPELEPGEPREPYEFAVDRNYNNTVETRTSDGAVRRRVAVWVKDSDPARDYITSWGR